MTGRRPTEDVTDDGIEVSKPRTWSVGVTSSPPRWDAIILAGGRASRLGGIDKTALVYQGRSLLQRALDAVGRADQVSLVGYDGSLEASPRVRRAEEHPRWGGPASAIVAGLHSLRDSDSDFTAVVAGDLPRVASALTLLVEEIGCGAIDEGFDGLMALDSSAHPQPLLAVYRTHSLRTAAASVASATNLSVLRLIGSLSLREVRMPDELCADVDTPHDAARLGIPLPPLGVATPTG